LWSLKPFWSISDQGEREKSRIEKGKKMGKREKGKKGKKGKTIFPPKPKGLLSP
jgi:hypothetical protein